MNSIYVEEDDLDYKPENDVSKEPYEEVSKVVYGAKRLTRSGKLLSRPSAIQEPNGDQGGANTIMQRVAKQKQKRKIDDLWAEMSSNPSKISSKSLISNKSDNKRVKVTKSEKPLAQQGSTVAKKKKIVSLASLTRSRDQKSRKSVPFRMPGITSTASRSKSKTTSVQDIKSVVASAKAKLAASSAKKETTVLFAGKSTVVVTNDDQKQQSGAGQDSKNKSNVRPSSTIDSLLSSLQDGKKVSTLQKSSYDWDTFRSKSELADDMEKFKKDGYLTKQEFLQRVDLRKFEQEKEIRAVERAKRDRQAASAGPK